MMQQLLTAHVRCCAQNAPAWNRWYGRLPDMMYDDYHALLNMHIQNKQSYLNVYIGPMARLLKHGIEHGIVPPEVGAHQYAAVTMINQQLVPTGNMIICACASVHGMAAYTM